MHRIPSQSNFTFFIQHKRSHTRIHKYFILANNHFVTFNWNSFSLCISNDALILVEKEFLKPGVLKCECSRGATAAAAEVAVAQKRREFSVLFIETDKVHECIPKLEMKIALYVCVCEFFSLFSLSVTL